MAFKKGHIDPHWAPECHMKPSMVVSVQESLQCPYTPELNVKEKSKIFEGKGLYM